MERDDGDDCDRTDPVEREDMAARGERTGVSLSSCSLPRVPWGDPAFLPNRSRTEPPSDAPLRPLEQSARAAITQIQTAGTRMKTRCASPAQ